MEPRLLRGGQMRLDLWQGAPQILAVNLTTIIYG
jgi:hypothetical protein